MKKWICFLMVCLLLGSLAACHLQENTISFYYIQVSQDPSTGSRLLSVAPEIRELDTNGRDLLYLLRIYLEGPLTDGYTLPFPKGTLLTAAVQEGSRITVQFNLAFASLHDADRTIAAACLASTCFGLTDAEEITILSGSMDPITLTKSSFIFSDNSAATPTQ